MQLTGSKESHTALHAGIPLALDGGRFPIGRGFSRLAHFVFELSGRGVGALAVPVGGATGGEECTHGTIAILGAGIPLERPLEVLVVRPLEAVPLYPVYRCVAAEGDLLRIPKLPQANGGDSAMTMMAMIPPITDVWAAGAVLAESADRTRVHSEPLAP